MFKISLKTKAFLFIVLAGFIFLNSPLPAQEKAGEKKVPPAKSYTVSSALSPIKIDAVLDEEAWKNVEIIDLPYEEYPGDNTPALVKTECLITFDSAKLYIALRCFDPEPGKIRSHLMDRDDIAGFVEDDFVAVTIDTFNDQRRGFEFALNAVGVQADALASELDASQDWTWDSIWDSAAKITDSGYVVEMAIPFTQLRFPHTREKQTWGFNIERSYPRDTGRLMISHAVDRDIVCSLCQANKITGFENMTQGHSLELAPTLTASKTDQREDFPAGKMKAGKIEVEPGLNARWGISPNLTLNATVNPDFSQVEADALQLEVNTRFALEYPEKRPFFLEGKDFFYTPLETVFTRTVYNPLWGVKLMGKIGKSAIGIFSTQDRYNSLLFPSNQGSAETALDKDTFSGVVRYRGDIGKGSTLGFLYTGRMGTGYHNHVVGVDGFLRLTRAKDINFQMLHSSTDYPDNVATEFGQKQGNFDGNALYAKFSHASHWFNYGLTYEDLGTNFRTDYGFMPRVDTRRINAFIEPVYWGKPGSWVEKMNFNIQGERITDHNGLLTDQDLVFTIIYQGPLQSIGNLIAKIRKEYYNGVTYDLTKYLAAFRMTPVGAFNFIITARIGDAIDYDNSRKADSLMLKPGFEWRIGGHLNVTVNHIYEKLTLRNEKIYTANLLEARLGYHFNTRLFLRAIIQYTDISRNTALYLMPVDAREKYLFTQFLFSYKINPQTVLFLGYSDNHFGSDEIPVTRNDRTFFLKIGYALGL